MAKKKAYPLRMDTDVLAAMQRLADDELRSLNAQIEYVCRQTLRSAGRFPGEESQAELQKELKKDTPNPAK